MAFSEVSVWETEREKMCVLETVDVDGGRACVYERGRACVCICM